MATKANLQVHFSTVGDIVLDQVYNFKENPSSLAMVFTQSVPAGFTPPGGIIIFNPFPIQGYVLNGLIVVPPRDNIYQYFFAFGPDPGSILYHPSNPSVFSIQDMPVQPELAHKGPLPIPFTFIWF